VKDQFLQDAGAGTPGYMAPERLHGERPTKATDLFALGAVLHQVSLFLVFVRANPGT
jgi:serine/threonine protein kinase